MQLERPSPVFGASVKGRGADRLKYGGWLRETRSGMHSFLWLGGPLIIQVRMIEHPVELNGLAPVAGEGSKVRRSDLRRRIALVSECTNLHYNIQSIQKIGR